MKFAIASLKQKQLTDEQLEAIYGGGGAPLGVSPVLAAIGGSGSQACDTRVHSFSVLCDISVFSLNAVVLPIVNIADQTTQTCANSH
jgi:bacteriocin-like protein